MAVKNAMYLFEVVVDSVKTFVESRALTIKSDFADIFSLDLKDPKQMHIVIPDPPPLPPEPLGKKGKKAKKPKPKKKKGKKGVIELPPPEPLIQSGQSVLFSSSAEFLIQEMNKCPMEVSLWSKEENLVFIGSISVPWDPVFLTYLQKILECQEPMPPTVKDEYNIFEEGTAKIIAKVSLQVKLTYLSERVTTAFRTLSEDPTVKKVLYTGVNSKTTSYICNMKTTDEDFEENSNKIENNYVIDKPKPKPIVFADFKNAPGANLTFFNEGELCCLGHADKPPESIYKAPETCPDIDFIVDYVRKIIRSCNDNMRMLTPRPTIRPRIKATDIDRLCYCKETAWPDGKLAERFRKEVQGPPCPICINAGKKAEGPRGTTFDVANIRGPCGRPECRIARDMKAYIENLIIDDSQELTISDIVGPCGSKDCTLAIKIQQFLRREGEFKEGATLEGLSTQCACVKVMQDSLTKKRSSCVSICNKECDDESESDPCEGKSCPHKEPEKKEQVYHVYYFTVEYDEDVPTPTTPSPASSTKGSDTKALTSRSASAASSSTKFKFCATECPSAKEEVVSCTKSICSTASTKQATSDMSKCHDPVCPDKGSTFPPSPADSDIVIHFDAIHNPCCVKACDVADEIKDFIVEGITNKNNNRRAILEDDPCYCDCTCTFKFTGKTTYCAVCGGYECLGDDVRNLPEFQKPHPCPVYHKLYDKKNIRVKSPWPEDESSKKHDAGTGSIKGARQAGSKGGASQQTKQPQLIQSRSVKNLSDKKSEEKIKKTKHEKKKVGKFTANVTNNQKTAVKFGHSKCIMPYTGPPWAVGAVHVGPVPRNMGWLWTAEDIPGMKPRPKWKPGAANKILVRRYRAIREGVDNIAKKKRALLQRKKKIEMKPTLVVKKLDGEYTVQMEVFKKYSKDRLLFQYPYDEKPPLMYSIGKTPDEKSKIQKTRERRERRENRRKSRVLQSTFRDKCQEICLKAYNQAIGLLPLVNPNNPECPCEIEEKKAPSPIIDSCSCSEEGSISSSDTDGDDWIIEFTPPLARWDAKAKHPPVLQDNDCQYSYLDYKVKLNDKQGNPVVRFFKGPDGKQECSDLGGFWGQDKTWLEINKDGWIGPDNRWVPINFTGPDGMFYLSEDGYFTDHSGKVWKIGIDGYVDKDNKWAWYSKRQSKETKSLSNVTGTMKSPKPAKADASVAPSGKAKPGAKGKSPVPQAAALPDPGKGGKGGDKKPVLAPAAVKGAEKHKKTVSLPGGRGKNPLVMSVGVKHNRYSPQYETNTMRHMDPKKLSRYREIMAGLKIYDDLCELKPPPVKTNRAMNTVRKKISPFTMDCSFKNAHQNFNVDSCSANMASASSNDTSRSPVYR